MKMKPLKNKKQMPNTKDFKSSDIISLILRDHEEIKKLILVLKSTKVDITKKRPAYAQFENILSNHAKAEQESLYVHMKKEDKLRPEGLEGDSEHAIADQLIKEIGLIKNDKDNWMAKVKVLAELVDHHVKEEEENVLRHVRKEFDIDMRKEIGKEYLNLLNGMTMTQNQKVKYIDVHDGRPVSNIQSGKNFLKTFIDNINGKVGVPILLYFLGVPGILVIFIWAIFFRGK